MIGADAAAGDGPDDAAAGTARETFGAGAPTAPALDASLPTVDLINLLSGALLWSASAELTGDDALEAGFDNLPI